MTLGIALLLIFILYLIDKHNRWRIAAKLTAGLIVLCILAVGGFFGWQKYDAYRTEKRTEAEAAAFQAKVKACVAKSTPAGNATAAQEQEAACEVNPNSPVILDFSKAVSITPDAPLVPQGQYTAADIDRPTKPKRKLKTESQQQIDFSKYATPPNCEAVACFDWGLVTGEYGSRIESRNCFNTDLTSRVSCENIAVLKKGDRVQILSDKVRAPDGSDIYETKFQQWTGWVRASDLSPEKGEEK